MNKIPKYKIPKYKVGDALMIDLNNREPVLQEIIRITEVRVSDEGVMYDSSILYTSQTKDVYRPKPIKNINRFWQGSPYEAAAVKINNIKAARVLFTEI